MKSPLVIKFGGTSLADEAARGRAADTVVRERASGRGVIAVVSALGRRPAAYATDTLLALAPEASDGPNRDLLLACGEMISAAIFAEMLEARGVAARALTGGQAGIITDAAHGNAHIVRVEPQALQALLEADVVPVVCGYQGVDEDGAITTLGRGGSDLTAMALAGALASAELVIVTDVDGVMTADPNRVPQARTIPHLSFAEASELSEHGARVLHDKAAQLARVKRIPFSVRKLSGGRGSTVDEGRTQSSEHPVTGVATMMGYTFLHVVPEAAVLPGGWEQDALRALSEAQISIDCANVNAAGLFFIVKDADLAATIAKLEPLPVALRIRRECAKISVVGEGMRGTPGVMYRTVRALSLAGVPIIHSTDSNITISVLVPATLAAMAENALHEHFDLQPVAGGQ